MGIVSKYFTDCKWSVTFTDTKKDSTIFTVKDAEIVDASTNRVFKPQNVYPFTPDGTEKTVEFIQSESNNTVIYYRLIE